MASKQITISAPNFETIVLHIKGTAPLMQCKFSEKAKQAMMSKMASTARAKRAPRSARNYEEDFKQAQHISTDGWNGIPASAFRKAAIRACKMVGFAMTDARMSIFVKADGYGTDGSPLVKLIADDPEMSEMTVRIQQTTDIRIRPVWHKWETVLTITYDADQFRPDDVYNLFMRAGMQVGVGEGRPSSKSGGIGYGTFEIIETLS